METVASLLVAVVMFLHAWQFFGLSEPKTTGIVGAVGAVGLGGLVIFKPLLPLSKVDLSALSSSVVVWAIYAALVAAVGLWNFDTRGFGLYSILAALWMLGQVYYTAAVKYTLGGLLEGVFLMVAFGMLFFYWAVPFKVLRRATAWVLVVVSVLVFLLNGALVGGVKGLV